MLQLQRVGHDLAAEKKRKKENLESGENYGI